MARLFAQPGVKFGAQTSWQRNAEGLPVLDGVLACLALVPISRVDVGKDALVIGQVVAATCGSPQKGPLVQYNGTLCGAPGRREYT